MTWSNYANSELIKKTCRSVSIFRFIALQRHHELLPVPAMVCDNKPKGTMNIINVSCTINEHTLTLSCQTDRQTDPRLTTSEISPPPQPPCPTGAKMSLRGMYHRESMMLRLVNEWVHHLLCYFVPPTSLSLSPLSLLQLPDQCSDRTCYSLQWQIPSGESSLCCRIPDISKSMLCICIIHSLSVRFKLVREWSFGSWE